MERDSKKFRDFIKNYWRYYRELEDEFLSIRRYVDFQKDNFGTYSVEFLKLYQAICSEIDVIGKAMAVELDSSFKPDDGKNNIYKWWYIIQNKFTVNEEYSNIESEGIALCETEVCLIDEFILRPWKSFVTEEYEDARGSIRYRTVDSKGSPEWWSAYNKVKHVRTFASGKKATKINYTKANLGNVCQAFAALYILEKSYMQALGNKSELEAFAEYSVLFDKIENVTSADIDKMFE